MEELHVTEETIRIVRWLQTSQKQPWTKTKHVYKSEFAALVGMTVACMWEQRLEEREKFFFFSKTIKCQILWKSLLRGPPREQGATRHGHQSSMSDNHRSTKQNLSKGSLSNSVCCIQSVWSVAWNVCREPAGILNRGPWATLIKLQQKTVSDLHVKLSSSSCSQFHYETLPNDKTSCFAD